uniref:Uncharacterized protein n=1 Tax=Oryza rufipogon TaxID=4529 RepID=A0A0E0QPT5_ORYRU
MDGGRKGRGWLVALSPIPTAAGLHLPTASLSPPSPPATRARPPPSRHPGRTAPPTGRRHHHAAPTSPLHLLPRALSRQGAAELRQTAATPSRVAFARPWCSAQKEEMEMRPRERGKEKRKRKGVGPTV